mmetsp:Transcript_7339/g.18044  ORF Transcript_7339/g.18044 Transcript_7339/m.18044 type:complete len:138 (-) Transcript_7339:601-1014(-)
MVSALDLEWGIRAAPIALRQSEAASAWRATQRLRCRCAPGILPQVPTGGTMAWAAPDVAAPQPEVQVKTQSALVSTAGTVMMGEDGQWIDAEPAAQVPRVEAETDHTPPHLQIACCPWEHPTPAVPHQQDSAAAEDW